MTSKQLTDFLMSNWDGPVVTELREAWKLNNNDSVRLSDEFTADMRDFVEAHDDPETALMLFLLSRRTAA